MCVCQLAFIFIKVTNKIKLHILTTNPYGNKCSPLIVSTVLVGMASQVCCSSRLASCFVSAFQHFVFCLLALYFKSSIPLNNYNKMIVLIIILILFSILFTQVDGFPLKRKIKKMQEMVNKLNLQIEKQNEKVSTK